MKKIRRIIVSILSILYIILFMSKMEIPRGLFIVMLGIILINGVVEAWDSYVETKNKFYLLIPISSIAIIIYVGFKLMSKVI